jgi:hypothetical protein
MVGGNYELVAIGNPLLDMQVRDGEEVLKKVRGKELFVDVDRYCFLMLMLLL